MTPPTDLAPGDARMELARRVARSGPIGMAEVCSRGQYRAARHHLLLEQKVLDVIDRGGRLIVSFTVRSGKTEFCSRWLPSWYLASHPYHRVIVGSHEADFAASHGRFARDRLEEWGPALFDMRVDQASHAAGRWDVEGTGGGMVCVGVGGAPIGRGANLMVIDDPHPNFAKAMSAVERQKVKDWWTGTLRSRLQPGAAVIVVCSRWHEDDLPGWLLKEFPDDWEELRVPALCDDPENDPLGRQLGEALWPEAGWTEAEYERARKETTARYGEMVWLAQYQQTARRPKGNMFKEDTWRYCDLDEVPSNLRMVRAWDLAGTEGAGDWTVGVKIGIDPATDLVYVVDVVRDQKGPDGVDKMMRSTAELDGPRVPVHAPQDPGQAGKSQVRSIVKLLKGFRVQTDPVTGDKETRAWPLASQQRQRNVVVVRAPWTERFCGELEGFPTGANDDQVDAAADAYSWALSLGGGLRA